MSYMGGRHIVTTLNSHYSKERVEAGVVLTCQKCKREKLLKIPHSLKNKDIVAKFRKLGWQCTDQGYKAKCPKCVEK